MKRVFLFLLMLVSAELQAGRCLQALVFDGSDNSRAQLINLEPVSIGAFRATHNIPQFASPKSDIEIEGSKQELKPSLSVAPALHFFWHAHRRGIITDQDVHVEAIRLSDMAPLRAVTLMSGDWMGMQELLREQDRRDLKPGSTPAVFTAMRLKGKPFEIIDSKIDMPPDREAEYFVPKNLLTISSAQAFTVGKGTERKALPWQSYPEYFDHIIPSDVIAFESGKASAEDSKQFPQMFQIAAFIMLKEAIALNQPFVKVVNYVHSPDAAHHRLYENWGLSVVQNAKNNSEHRLYAITLEEMLELKRYDPSQYSERLALMKKHSDYEVSAQTAYRHNTTLKELMSIYLDTSFASLGEEASRIRVDDRSIGLQFLAQALLGAAGIEKKFHEFTNELNKVRSIRYIDNHPGSYLPEEFEAHPLNGNLFIQEVSEKAAIKDPKYLPKLLWAVADWYNKTKLQALRPGERNFAAHTLVFSVITSSSVIVQQAQNLGLRIKPLRYKVTDIADEHGTITQTQDLTSKQYFELSIPFLEILSSFQNYNGQAQVQRGHWAIQNLLYDPLLD